MQLQVEKFQFFISILLTGAYHNISVIEFGSLVMYDMAIWLISFTCTLTGSLGWFVFSHGVFINCSQSWKARVACIAPIDKLVCCWYDWNFSFFFCLPEFIGPMQTVFNRRCHPTTFLFSISNYTIFTY